MKLLLPEKTEEPFSPNDYNLAAWQHELISVMGSRKHCLAFLASPL